MFYLSNLQKMCLFACIDFGGVGDRQNHHPLSFQGYIYIWEVTLVLFDCSKYIRPYKLGKSGEPKAVHTLGGRMCWYGVALGRCSEALANLSLVHHSC
jgi:hypothetical protein